MDAAFDYCRRILDDLEFNKRHFREKLRIPLLAVGGQYAIPNMGDALRSYETGYCRLRSISQHRGLAPHRSKVVQQDLLGAPHNLSPVVGPLTLAPVAVAARLRGH